MWNTNDNIIKLLEQSTKKEDGISYICPVCNEKEAHVYYHRFEEDDIAGPAWGWCSACKSYTHVRYMIPKWWTNLPTIDEESLCSSPEYLESIKSTIDEHMDMILKNISE